MMLIGSSNRQNEHVEVLALRKCLGLLNRLNGAGIANYLPYSVAAQQRGMTTAVGTCCTAPRRWKTPNRTSFRGIKQRFRRDTGFRRQ